MIAVKGDTPFDREPMAPPERRPYARPSVGAHRFDSVIQSGTGPVNEGARGMQMDPTGSRG